MILYEKLDICFTICGKIFIMIATPSTKPSASIGGSAGLADIKHTYTAFGLGDKLLVVE